MNEDGAMLSTVDLLIVLGFLVLVSIVKDVHESYINLESDQQCKDDDEQYRRVAAGRTGNCEAA